MLGEKVAQWTRFGRDSLKKIILGIVIVLAVFFAYEYQKPIMTTGEATKHALTCLNNPPKKLGIKPFNRTINNIQTVQASLEPKSGFLSKLTNGREWRVTLIFKGSEEPTVTMNAYNGKCIGVSGPLS